MPSDLRKHPSGAYQSVLPIPLLFSGFRGLLADSG